MIKGTIHGDSIKRFWNKVRKTDSCWLWTAAKSESGYGIFGVKNETDKAHRISWKLIKGDIPNKLFVLHRCDVRDCVNPDHLFLGTNHDNVKDMIQKNRNSAPPHMAGHNRIDIPREYVPILGKFPDYLIAKKLGVTKSVIRRHRQIRGIPSYAVFTGNDGRYKPGKDHSRWR